uniref:Uncharacterized protein n=1 Tax=Xiphophorus couchianus TaxID=32473 RepID=A0A3B5KV76_9TELE
WTIGSTGCRRSLFDAGVKGRGLRASRELSAGEVLLAEPGYAAVLIYPPVDFWEPISFILGHRDRLILTREADLNFISKGL